jgi:hypothetical protein
MKIEINIPENLNEITLHQYQLFDKLDLSKEAEVRLKMIEIFCNANPLVARNMKATDIVEICEHINKMFDVKHQLINTFTLDGIEYGFIPSLDEMSFGEYVDLDTFIGDMENIHRAMNVLYRPIEHKRKGKYTIKPYDTNNADRMKLMPLSAALGAMVFFWNLGIELSEVMMNYSVKANEENLVQYLNSEANGDGTIQSMESLKEILQSLKISLN